MSLTETFGLTALLLALCLPAIGQPVSPEMRLDQLKAKGVDAEITVYPVRLGTSAMPPVGEVLAMLLERGGI